MNHFQKLIVSIFLLGLFVPAWSQEQPVKKKGEDSVLLVNEIKELIVVKDNIAQRIVLLEENNKKNVEIVEFLVKKRNDVDSQTNHLRADIIAREKLNKKDSASQNWLKRARALVISNEARLIQTDKEIATLNNFIMQADNELLTGRKLVSELSARIDELKKQIDP